MPVDSAVPIVVAIMGVLIYFAFLIGAGSG